jgi:hypothetical protein
MFQFARLRVVKDAHSRASCGRVEVKLVPCAYSHKGVLEGPVDRFVEGSDRDPKEPLRLKEI